MDGVHVGELGFVYVVSIGDKAVRCFSFYSEKPIVRCEKQTLPVVVLQPQAMSLCVRKVPFMGWASVAKLALRMQKAPSPCFSRYLLLHYLACFALCIFDDIHTFTVGLVYTNAIEGVYFHLFVVFNAGQVVDARSYVDGVEAIFA